jgi:hypothetical protein
MAAVGRGEQRGLEAAVAVVRVGAVGEEEGDHVDAPERASDLERGPRGSVGVGGDAGGEMAAHGLEVPLARGDEEALLLLGGGGGQGSAEEQRDRREEGGERLRAGEPVHAIETHGAGGVREVRTRAQRGSPSSTGAGGATTRTAGRGEARGGRKGRGRVPSSEAGGAYLPPVAPCGPRVRR